MAHACDLSTGEAKAGGLLGVNGNLGYRVSFRLA